MPFMRRSERGGHRGSFLFPGTCIVSPLDALHNGATAEISLTGHEGGIGLGLILRGGATLTRATVQTAGTALRWKTSASRREVKRAGAGAADAAAIHSGAMDPEGAVGAVQSPPLRSSSSYADGFCLVSTALKLMCCA